MSTSEKRLDTEKPGIDLIQAALANNDCFAYRFLSSPETTREINIRVIRDEEAEEFVNDFQILTQSWRQSNLIETLRSLQASIRNAIARIQIQKVKGASSIMWYVIREEIITRKQRRAFTIVLTPRGELNSLKATATVKNLGTGHARETSLDRPTTQVVLDQIIHSLASITPLQSNTVPATDTETVLDEMLNVLELRLTLLADLRGIRASLNQN